MVLRATLASYGLIVGGKRAELIDRLQEFAQDEGSWISCACPLAVRVTCADHYMIPTHSLFRGQRKRKRGDISGSRTKARSAKRITTMFSTDASPVEYAYRHGHDHRPAQALPEAKIAKIYALVSPPPCIKRMALTTRQTSKVLGQSAARPAPVQPGPPNPATATSQASPSSSADASSSSSESTGGAGGMLATHVLLPAGTEDCAAPVASSYLVRPQLRALVCKPYDKGY